MRRPLMLILAVVVAGLIAYALRPPTQASDRQQVTSALLDAATQLEAKNVGGAMSHVSADYRDAAGFDRTKLRMLAADALRGAETVSIQLVPTRVELRGDRATVDADVTVSARPKKGEPLPRQTRPLRFFMAREPARRLLVLPASAWRVTGIDGWQGFVDLSDLWGL